MGSPVFANSQEIASKSMSGKSICEFPDVCWTPPQTPATPNGVPIPYPNTGYASDTTDGSSSVTIGGQEVMLKDVSYFKKCMGDEAGKAPQKGMMTSTTTGKVYFIAWSMNVLIESENADRNLDMTTHNHGSTNSTGAAPTAHVAGASVPPPHDKCQLTTYDPNNCPSGTTPHHLVPDSLFKISGSGAARVPGVTLPEGSAGYNAGLCICLTGQDKAATITDNQISELGLDPNRIGRGADGVRRLNARFLRTTRVATGRVASMFPGWAGASPFAMTRGEHGMFHNQFDNIVKAIGGTKAPPCTHTATFGEQCDVAAQMCATRFGCSEKDIKEQLENHYRPHNVDRNTVMRSSDARTQQPVNPSMLGNVPGNPCSA